MSAESSEESDRRYAILKDKLQNHLSTLLEGSVIYYFMETPGPLISYDTAKFLKETHQYHTKVDMITKLPTKTPEEKHELLSVLTKHYHKNTKFPFATSKVNEPDEETLNLYKHLDPLLPKAYTIITRETKMKKRRGEIIFVSHNFQKKLNSYQHFVTEISELALKDDVDLSGMTLTLISADLYQEDRRFPGMTFEQMLFTHALEGREMVFKDINIL